METNTHKQSSSEKNFITEFKEDMNNKLDIYLNKLFEEYETDRPKT